MREPAKAGAARRDRREPRTRSLVDRASAGSQAARAFRDQPPKSPLQVEGVAMPGSARQVSAPPTLAAPQ